MSKSPGSLCLLLVLAGIKPVVICTLPLVGFSADIQRGIQCLKSAHSTASLAWLFSSCFFTHCCPAPWCVSPHRYTGVQPQSFQFTVVVVLHHVLCTFGCTQHLKQFLLIHLHRFVGRIFSLFLSCPGFTVFSLAAQRHMRSSFCSVKFDSSLAGSLQGPQAVQGWQPQSCFPLTPWAPRTCSVNHLQERPIQWKLLLCPRLCSAYSSRASKEQKGLKGEIL